MRKILLLILLLVSSLIVIGQNDLILAKYYKIYSGKIGEDREIYVSVPEEYEKSDKKYPVIYMMDGEFNATPGLIGSIRYLEFLGQIPEFIVVGIKNTNREKDIFPQEVTYRDGTKAGGRADQYLSFIYDELIPFIDKTYRTEEYKILFGTSNTGFTTVYAMFQKPEVFNAYIAASATLSIPVFTAGRDSLVQNWKGGEKFLYLVMGEHDFPTVIRLNGNLKEVIDIHKPAGLTCRLSVLEGEGHVPGSSLSEGLKCLFRDWKYSGNSIDIENPEVKKHYEDQKRKYGFTGDLKGASVTYVGNAGFLIKAGDIDLQQFSYDDFRNYQLPEKKIDLAFIQHFLLTPDPGESKFVREGIGSRYVLPSHYHYTVPPLDTALVLRNYPDAVLFRNELQNWIMPVGK